MRPLSLPGSLAHSLTHSLTPTGAGAIKLLRRIARPGRDVREEHQAKEAAAYARAKEAEGLEAKKASAAMLAKTRSAGYVAMLQHTSIVEGLCSRLHDFNREVRWLAAQVLGSIAEVDDPQVVDALAGLLDSDFDEVRMLAPELIRGMSIGMLVSRGMADLTDNICVRLAADRHEVRTAAAEALLAHCEVPSPPV